MIHALILLNCDRGEFSESSQRTNKEIAAFFQVGERMVDRIRKRFVEEGLESALEDKPSEREYKHKIDSISHETVRRTLKKQIKTVEEKGMGHSSIAKR